MSGINILTGQHSSITSTLLTLDEVQWFKDYYSEMVEEKTRIDPDIGKSFAKQQHFYETVAAIAKTYMTEPNKPFRPYLPSLGEFGCRDILPQDTGKIEWPTGQSTVHTWRQKITVPAKTAWTDLFGTSEKPITPSNAQNYHCLFAFHALVSLKPRSRIIGVRNNIDNFQGYPVHSVELAVKKAKGFDWLTKRIKQLRVPAKDAKEETKNYSPFIIIPMQGDFLILPGVSFNIRCLVEKDNFEETETYQEEIAPLGLIFAEYDYLRTELS
jgi:hypothetical protein